MKGERWRVTRLSVAKLTCWKARRWGAQICATPDVEAEGDTEGEVEGDGERDGEGNVEGDAEGDAEGAVAQMSMSPKPAVREAWPLASVCLVATV